MQALNEVQTAARAGFVRLHQFAKARKRGMFPPPIQEMPGVGPIWSERQIAEWLGETLPEGHGSGKRALDRLE